VACSRVRGAHPSPPDKMIPNTQQRGYWVCCCFRCLARRRPSAQRACPSGVLGPVLKPPCIRHRPLRGRLCSRSQTAGAWQGRPDRVFAPQRGRSRFGVTLSRRSSTSNSRQGVKPLPKASAMASSTVSRRVSIGHNPISRVWTGDNIRQPRLSPRQAAQDRRCCVRSHRLGLRAASSTGPSAGRICVLLPSGCGRREAVIGRCRRRFATAASAAAGRLRAGSARLRPGVANRVVPKLCRFSCHRWVLFRRNRLQLQGLRIPVLLP